MSEAREARIREMAASDDLFVLGVVGAMRRWRARHAEVREAMRRAEEVRPEAAARARARRRYQRLRQRVIKYEVKYPQIFRHALSGSLRSAASRYQISHAWVSVIMRALRELARQEGRDVQFTLESVERDAHAIRHQSRDDSIGAAGGGS